MTKLFTIIASLFFMQTAVAQEICATLQVDDAKNSNRYILKQHNFENSQDLVMIDPLLQIRRVTFGRGALSAVCPFKPLALAQGGDWGWHILWAEPVGLYYARMDGEAWVSSNPKRLTKLVPINPQFNIQAQMITITWQQLENGLTANMQAISSDEGRSWDTAAINP